MRHRFTTSSRLAMALFALAGISAAPAVAADKAEKPKWDVKCRSRSTKAPG
jgi:hypothetical protein